MYSPRNELTKYDINGVFYYHLQYDLRGNTTKMSTTYGPGYVFTYLWDSRNLLTKSTRADGGVEQWAVEYKYDTFGRRAARRADTGSGFGDWIWYFYDGLNVVAEGTGTSDKIWHTTSGSPVGGIICRDDNGTKYWYHYDRLGNVVGVTDADGNVSRVYQNRSAFGYYYSATVYDSSGYDAYHNDVQPYHQTTKEMDATTGLCYFNARWYNASLGRFISRDIIRSVNQYSMCRVPNCVDPDGRKGVCCKTFDFTLDHTNRSSRWDIDYLIPNRNLVFKRCGIFCDTTQPEGTTSQYEKNPWSGDANIHYGRHDPVWNIAGCKKKQGGLTSIWTQAGFDPPDLEHGCYLIDAGHKGWAYEPVLTWAVMTLDGEEWFEDGKYVTLRDRK